MINICVNMMVRNGEDCVKQSLLSVLPFVKKVVVAIDSRSTDNTRQIINDLKLEWNNLEVYDFEIIEPYIDLVKCRNFLLSKITEPYGWTVDSDEVYPEWEIKTIRLEGHISYGFRRWSVWNETHCDRSTSRSPSMRIFRKYMGLEWVGIWGKEKLMLGEIDFCYSYLTLPQRYIHFTHWKNDNWREEMNHSRKVDGRNLSPMPIEIINLIKQIYVKKM
jgi:glycosyltransferase involved in cell wall biosynthesis